MCNHDKLKINEVWEHLFFTLMSHFGAIFSELAPLIPLPKFYIYLWDPLDFVAQRYPQKTTKI